LQNSLPSSHIGATIVAQQSSSSAYSQTAVFPAIVDPTSVSILWSLDILSLPGYTCHCCAIDYWISLLLSAADFRRTSHTGQHHICMTLLQTAHLLPTEQTKQPNDSPTESERPIYSDSDRTFSITSKQQQTKSNTHINIHLGHHHSKQHITTSHQLAHTTTFTSNQHLNQLIQLIYAYSTINKAPITLNTTFKSIPHHTHS